MALRNTVEEDQKQTVYIAVSGMYESTMVLGVYASAEAAMKANPIPPDYEYPEKPSASNNSRPTGWQVDEHGNWRNGLDWADHIEICPYEVES